MIFKIEFSESERLIGEIKHCFEKINACFNPNQTSTHFANYSFDKNVFHSPEQLSQAIKSSLEQIYIGNQRLLDSIFEIEILLFVFFSFYLSISENNSLV